MPSPDPVSDPAFEAFDATRDGWPPLADSELHLWLLPHRRGRPSIDALRPCIARYLDIHESAVEITRGSAGKPGLANPPADLQFSASHSGDALLLGFLRLDQIGVDIERAKPRPHALELARRYFASDEADALAMLSPAMRETGFYRLWTAKEALLKGLGHGLAHGLDHVAFKFGREGLMLTDPDLASLDRVVMDLTALNINQQVAWNLRECEPLPGYRAAVAWSGPVRRVCAWRIDT